VQYKKDLKERLEQCIRERGHEEGRFKEAEELDGNPDAGHVQTDVWLKDPANDSEDCISYDNLEAILNEHYLWHGTASAAAESIIKYDFKVGGAGGALAHGMRFGQGAYFAENLNKSLSYAPDDNSGHKWILLYPVTCGDYYYTERSSETEAHTTCQSQQKDSVLANPGGSGPCEFIVLNEKCVYPEFCLQVDNNNQLSDGEVAALARVVHVSL